MTNQINTAEENNENHQKLARKLNDIKQPSNPRQGKPEMTTVLSGAEERGVDGPSYNKGLDKKSEL